MKRTHIRILSLALCALLLCLLPCITAQAEEITEVWNVRQEEDGRFYYTIETVTQTAETGSTQAPGLNAPQLPGSLDLSPAPVAPSAITGYDQYNLEFENNSDLRTLLSRTYSEYTYATYTGTEPLVIDSNAVIPRNLSIHAPEATLTVAEGATLLLEQGADGLIVDTLIVNGTVENRSYISAFTALTVNGTFNNYSQISVYSTTAITGKDRITFYDGEIVYSYFTATSQELVNAASAAAASTAAWERFHIVAEPCYTITHSVTIPANASFAAHPAHYPDQILTIASGAALVLDGSASVYVPIMVYGTLENNRSLWVDLYEETMDYFISIAEGGTYSGTGRLDLAAMREAVPSIQQALPGFDLSHFEITEGGDGYSCFWELRNIAGLTRLGTPTDLQWGYYVDYSWENGSMVEKLVEQPGNIVWKNGMPHQGECDITFYNAADDSPVTSHSWIGYINEVPEYFAVDSFCLEDHESGTYYFTVQEIGDYVTYASSERAVSDTWTYIKPAQQVAPVRNLTFNGTECSWDAPADTTHVDGYYVEFYFSSTEKGEPYTIGGTWCRDPEDTATELMDHPGSGYYYFAVKTLCEDITVACNSEWVMSEAYNYNAIAIEVEKELDDIVSSSETMTEEEIKEAVQSVDTENLEEAMRSDRYNNGVVEQISQLEEAVGGPATVEVSEEAHDFDPSLVTVVGASLNTTVSDTEGVTLVIDKPEQEHVLDTLYDSAVAVSFSMDLTNVEDTTQLQVPVKISMPIPRTINPDFLVILHYHADGTVEEIHPYIEVAGNQYFANFVLTSFSDFVMTETVAPDITRIAGINRIGTSMDIAKKLKSALGIFKFDSVIVASALNFPDALTGSYLAAVENAPILLTYDAVHAEVQEFIRDHLAVGGTVYILGGEGAVSKAFETGLEEFKVQRVAGSDRFGTNLEILKTAGYNADQPILIATAVNFADSLSASAAGLPMLLVHGSLRADQKEFLATTSRNFVIIGGTSAVSEELEAELKAIGNVERLAGNGRYQTSVMVAQKFISEPNAAVLAYARNFPDGLCGGPLAYALGAPLILTDNYDPSEADKYIEGIKTGIVVGGPGLISDESASLIFDLN